MTHRGIRIIPISRDHIVPISTASIPFNPQLPGLLPPQRHSAPRYIAAPLITQLHSQSGLITRHFVPNILAEHLTHLG